MATEKELQNAMAEVQDNLLLGKFNDAMNLMAQITIDVIEKKIDQALIVSKGYEEDLNVLLVNGIISQETAHNFNTLIVSGIQSYNGVQIPEEHAKKAFEVLSNELELIKNNVEYENLNKGANLTQKSRIKAKNANEYDNIDENMQNDEDVFYEEDDEPYPGDFTRDRGSEENAPAFMNNTDDFRSKERMRAESFDNEKRKRKKDPRKFVALIIPIVILLLIVVVIKMVVGNILEKKEQESIRIEREKREEESRLEESRRLEIEATREPETESEEGYYLVTGDMLRVRDATNTTSSKVLGLVTKGDLVHVIRFASKDWAEIEFDGKAGFISTAYIVKDNSGNALSNVAPLENEVSE